jgi:hypothetical protein
VVVLLVRDHRSVCCRQLIIVGWQLDATLLIQLVELCRTVMVNVMFIMRPRVI